MLVIPLALAAQLNMTSTLALYAALRQLGYTSYHMAECSLDTENNSMAYWREALAAKLYGQGKKYQGSDFDKMLWRYDVRSNLCVAPKKLQLECLYLHQAPLLSESGSNRYPLHHVPR